MAEKYEIGNYNKEIAAASSNIGQRLFAYISNGKDINDRIRDKFKKSLIFIGDEGQIYNPLTNTYVGIGQTAYIHTISYIEDAQEKIKTLQKMLASSMVSSIYANWYKDEWSDAIKGTKINPDGSTTKYSTPYYAGSQKDNVADGFELESGAKAPDLPSKIYATNEIILKGKGDYDPRTRLAATREYAHIVDKNATESGDDNDKKQQYLLDHTYKEIQPEKAFATSGITVSLEKGLNRYLFSYTFTNRDDGKGIGNAPDASPYSKVFNIYLTIDDYEAGVNGGRTDTILDEENRDQNGNPLEVVPGGEKVKLFYQGLVPQYNDGYVRRPETEAELSAVGGNNTDLKANKAHNLKNQLFKQNANTLVIDDTLTWSYIASAYSYTVSFAKEYTDAQVTQIYRDLLGENTTRLIPVTEAQVRNQLVNPDATLNQDSLVWNESTGKWEEKETAGSDGQAESSTNLSDYKLNYSSTFVGRYQLQSGSNLTSLAANTDVEIIGKAEHVTVLPWLVLAQLTKEIADATTEAKKIHDASNTIDANKKLHLVEEPKDLYEEIRRATEKTIYNFSYTSVVGTESTPFKFVANPDPNATHEDICAAVEDIAKKYYFMDFENDSKYAHEKEEFDRTHSFKDSKGDPEEGTPGMPDESGKGQYGSDGAEDGRDYGYTGTQYSLPYVYRIITDQNIDDVLSIEKENESKTFSSRALFAVNSNWTSMSGINLADGINTLKEIAYVLDIITDGWGNQYNPDDPEGSGILLTYTIANNHERIEDHEARLRKLEGGKNIVKAIYADDHTTGKYVNIHLASDTSWICTLATNTTPNNEGVWTLGANNSFTGLDLETDWFGVFNGRNADGEQMYAYAVPKSYIISYNALMKEYLTHKAKDADNEGTDYHCPKFSDIYDANQFDIFKDLKTDGHEITFKGFIEPAGEAGPGEPNFFKDAKNAIYPVDSAMHIPTYVGQVGIGIDLKLATTYTSSIFCEENDDPTGFIAVDLNSALIKKNAELVVTLPKHIPHDKVTSFVYENTEIDEPKINYSKPTESIYRYANPAELVKTPAVIDCTGDIIQQLITLGLGNNDANIVKEYIENYLPINELTLTTADGGAEQEVGAKCSMKFKITTADAVNNVQDPITKENTYRPNLYVAGAKTTIAGLTTVLGYDKIKEETLEVDVNDIPTTTNYYVRLHKLTEQKQVSLADNALTDVEWVTTYVNHVVSDVARKLKDVELESYQYTKGLINQLDSYYEAREGKYVAGINQINGIVTPIIKDLPKDTLTASVKVWGENTNDTKQYDYCYDQVSTEKVNELVNEIGMDTPIFVKTTDFDYQEIPAFDTALVVEDAPVRIGGKEVYEFDSETNDYINARSLERVRSSFTAGRDYAMFIQYYFRTPKYVQIDAADITMSKDGSICSYKFSEDVTYTEFYVLSDKKTQPVAKKEYISAESFHQIDETGGSGENVLKVTAHITKLSDATKNNSGLVDAYDVKNTIDNMFEWVDLSRWDLNYEEANPINTPVEEWPAITAEERIIDTKSSSTAPGRLQLGYPKEMFDYDSDDHKKPTEAPKA